MKSMWSVDHICMTIPDGSLRHKMYTCHIVLIGRHKIFSWVGRCGEIQVGFVLGHIGAVGWGVDWHQQLESAAWGSEHWHQSTLERGGGLLVALGGWADIGAGYKGWPRRPGSVWYWLCLVGAERPWRPQDGGFSNRMWPFILGWKPCRLVPTKASWFAAVAEARDGGRHPHPDSGAPVPSGPPVPPKHGG